MIHTRDKLFLHYELKILLSFEEIMSILLHLLTFTYYLLLYMQLLHYALHVLHVHLNILKAMIFNLIHLCNETFLD